SAMSVSPLSPVMLIANGPDIVCLKISPNARGTKVEVPPAEPAE
ncbi:hypothetical protein KIPB_014604, partial [Kipferlia bialata]